METVVDYSDNDIQGLTTETCRGEKTTTEREVSHQLRRTICSRLFSTRLGVQSRVLAYQCRAQQCQTCQVEWERRRRGGRRWFPTWTRVDRWQVMNTCTLWDYEYIMTCQVISTCTLAGSQTWMLSVKPISVLLSFYFNECHAEVLTRF